MARSTSADILKNRIATLLQGDRLIWVVVGLLIAISILAVYSSSEVLANRRNTYAESFLVKHIVLLVFALIVMYVAHLVNYMRYARFSTILLFITVPLLIYTMFFGVEINGARRWISIPLIGITLQSADFAKLAIILYVSRTIALMQNSKRSMSELVLPVLVVCVLIAPYDLSNALILFLTCILLMFVGRIELRSVFSLLMLGIGIFAILIILSDFFPWIRVDTWISRLKGFVEGGGIESDQVLQAKMAIAKGGLFGAGPGNGVQSYFLPHSYSDYIYCIIVEEYGMLGGAIVILLYILMLLRCVRMVTRSPKAFGAILSMGLCLSIVIQAFAHMAVSVDLLPVTGLTLPFVSLGGTSLLFTGFSFGIILSVSRYIESSTSSENEVGARSKSNKTKETEE